MKTLGGTIICILLLAGISQASETREVKDREMCEQYKEDGNYSANAEIRAVCSEKAEKERQRALDAGLIIECELLRQGLGIRR
ncbi:MAG: hypothetical protein HQL09_09430 [Nitrospirae bacterium]|nr:hypothetical protein [Nitrospirota bacterium]